VVGQLVHDVAHRERLRAEYAPQVARYLAAAEQLLGARPRAVMCFLNVDGAVQVVEDWG